LSPAALAVSGDGRALYIACETAAAVQVLDLAERKVRGTIAVDAKPSGFTLSPDGAWLYVTCAAPRSSVAVVDVAGSKVLRSFAAGHTALSPVLSPDGRTLFVCNRFDNEVAFIDTASGETQRRVAVPREPFAAAVTPDGRRLIVANHLHNGRADAEVVAASASLIDVASGRVEKEIALPNGSGLLRAVAISPDGKYAAITHQISRFQLPTTQIERGWINTNALSLIDLAKTELLNTVLLDNIDSGAANPWAASWSADGKRIVVTHAGTHELSVIDAPALLEKLGKLAAAPDANAKRDYTSVSGSAADVPNDLAFLVGLRRRIRLDERGPRALVLVGSKAITANYFSDSLSVVDFATEQARPETIALGPKPEPTLARKGEFYFNDALICFQGWQSCSSCHSHDARVDALNWDNLNDGIGNPKNAKSLLLAHQTAPSMALGVRADAHVSVRAGIRNSLFTVQPEEVAQALDAYLQSLQPIPSPHLITGKLSPAAERGRALFQSDQAGCTECHTTNLFTDRRMHDVGTRSRFDQPTDKFDVPTLVEVWRSAPYLHDGSAATVRDVLTTRNPNFKHGDVSKLTPAQLDDLVAYVLSL
jgi:YVTN family beta-propeller protein